MLSIFCASWLLDRDLPFACALDNGSFEFVVAPSKRFPRLD